VTTEQALTSWVPLVLPEILLVAAACVLFLGGTFRPNRDLWGTVALASLAAAALAAWLGPAAAEPTGAGLYVAPVLADHLSFLIRAVALVGGAVLVLLGWHEAPAKQAPEYHACLMVIVAGTSLTGMANDLVTLFLALELTSIPTYILLYLPRHDPPAQEAAMKYFLLSIFSSALLLFGFSYLYGLGGTTNIPALAEALSSVKTGALPGVALVALVMIVAGLGFRITAVPFHFYAPDVYQGTTAGAAALLAFVPKVAGFVALVRVLGFAPPAELLDVLEKRDVLRGSLLGGLQVSTLFWILAAVTMTLGNVLALLQDNLKRMLAYSSVAHAGYMLIGLAVAPYLRTAYQLPDRSQAELFFGGVEAVLFYLGAYGAMTIGAFAVLSYLNTPQRRVESVDDLAGLSRSHPVVALAMALFLFSLIGIPFTGGFAGKLLLFLGAMSVRPDPTDPDTLVQARLFRILALIAAINAAIGAWYYLRVVAAMYLRNPLRPAEGRRGWPVLAAIGVCALATVVLGVYPWGLLRPAVEAVPRTAPEARAER
jgi:NADH-quinone oxidoreductase subunit N